MTSSVVGGLFGNPDEVDIPGRSMNRIQRAIFDSDSRNASIDRVINFQAIRTPAGANVSQVEVSTNAIDGSVVEERVIILYRNSRFWKSLIEYEDVTVIEHTLSGAITRIGNPMQP